MNQKELIKNKEQIRGSYHVTGCANYVKRAKNAVYLSAANSIEHELAKAEVCWLLLKAGKDFITECCDNKTGLRRDVVCLDNGAIIEVETDEKRAQRFSNVASVVVIPLWKTNDVKKALLDVLD